MSQKNAVVATYQSHSQAEEALKELQKTGFDVKKLSIVGKDYHTEEKRRWILQCGRPDEAVGQVGRFLGRSVGNAAWGRHSSRFQVLGRCWSNGQNVHATRV